MKAPLFASGVCFIQNKLKQRLTVEELGVPIRHPKFLQGFRICTHPCNLGTHTVGPIPFHPQLDTTTLAININGVQRVCQILGHIEKVLQNLILCLLVRPLTLFRCVLSFTGGWSSRVGLGHGFAFRRLRFRLRFGVGGRKCCVTPAFSGDKNRIGCPTPAFSGAQKRAEMLRHPCIFRGPQQRGQNRISKPMLGVTMMPLVSQSMGL